MIARIYFRTCMIEGRLLKRQMKMQFTVVSELVCTQYYP